MKGRRLSLFLLLIMVSLLATGCWSRKELPDIAIILAAGVDRTPEGNVTLTLQIVKPSAASGGGGAGEPGKEQATVMVVSQTGKTVADAQQGLATRLSRKLHWPHCLVFIVGEAAARDGLRDITNYFSRSAEPRQTMWIAVTPGQALDIINSHSEIENTSAQAIAQMSLQNSGLHMEYHDFMYDLSSGESNPVAPRIEIIRQGTPQGPGGAKGEAAHNEAVFTGTAVFRGDRLVGWLDEKDTMGLEWLRGELEKGIFTVPSPSAPGKYLSFSILKSTTKVEPEFVDGKVGFHVIIMTDVDLIEQQDTADVTQPEILEAVQKTAADEIERYARDALFKMQVLYRTDGCHFGEHFHQKYKQKWKVMEKDWNGFFADAGADIHATVAVRHSGILGKQANLRESR
ncbi:MAG TPA: Ger(x)C family spore germination protein [Selenomonadales bacterium]|nr:Ger(x)C family spore germination protein [Selenomonadales bacterium]